MFGLKKFYCSYYQDAGFGAIMMCHGVFEAPDLKFARVHWKELFSGAYKYTAFQPIGEYVELFEVPVWMSEVNILQVYGGQK